MGWDNPQQQEAGFRPSGSYHFSELEEVFRREDGKRLELTALQQRQIAQSLELTHVAFAWVQILQRVSLAKPGDTDVDTWWG